MINDWSTAGTSAAVLCEPPAALVLVGLEPSWDSGLSDVTLDTTQALLDNAFIMARNSQISGAFLEDVGSPFYGGSCTRYCTRKKKKRCSTSGQDLLPPMEEGEKGRIQHRIPRCIFPNSWISTPARLNHVACFTIPACRQLDTCLCHYLSGHGIYSSIQGQYKDRFSRYGDSHVNDKMVARLSNLKHGDL